MDSEGKEQLPNLVGHYATLAGLRHCDSCGGFWHAKGFGRHRQACTTKAQAKINDQEYAQEYMHRNTVPGVCSFWLCLLVVQHAVKTTPQLIIQ